MIRGGKVDLSILGAMQVSAQGDIANWMVPGAMVEGNGRRDGPRRLREAAHRDDGARHEKGREEDPRNCALPLTGVRCVNRIITDYCVLDVTAGGLKLIEVAPGVTPEQVQEMTEPTLLVERDIKEIAWGFPLCRRGLSVFFSPFLKKGGALLSCVTEASQKMGGLGVFLGGAGPPATATSLPCLRRSVGTRDTNMRMRALSTHSPAGEW